MKQLTEKQKKAVVRDLYKNQMFNKFGLINIARLRGVNSELHNVATDALKTYIRERFDDEMVTEVSFLDEQKDK